MGDLESKALGRSLAAFFGAEVHPPSTLPTHFGSSFGTERRAKDFRSRIAAARRILARSAAPNTPRNPPLISSPTLAGRRRPDAPDRRKSRKEVRWIDEDLPRLTEAGLAAELAPVGCGLGKVAGSDVAPDSAPIRPASIPSTGACSCV